MIFTIHKNKHRAWPPGFGIFYNKKKMERIVKFDISCKYELPAADADDVNKLFGIGYFPGNHTDSARFGWNYNPANNKIRIYAYCYVAGERIIKEIGEVMMHRLIKLSIDKIGDVYSFTVSDALNDYYVYGGCDVSFSHNKKLSYKLGCYFGGNNLAPHTIKISMSRK